MRSYPFVSDQEKGRHAATKPEAIEATRAAERDRLVAAYQLPPAADALARIFLPEGPCAETSAQSSAEIDPPALEMGEPRQATEAAGAAVELSPTDPLKQAPVVSAVSADSEEPGEVSPQQPEDTGKFETTDGQPPPIEAGSTGGSHGEADDDVGQRKVAASRATQQETKGSRRSRKGPLGRFAAALRNLLLGGAGRRANENVPDDVPPLQETSRLAEPRSAEQKLALAPASQDRAETAGETGPVFDEMLNALTTRRGRFHEAEFAPSIEAVMAGVFSTAEFSAQAGSSAASDWEFRASEARAEVSTTAEQPLPDQVFTGESPPPNDARLECTDAEASCFHDRAGEGESAAGAHKADYIETQGIETVDPSDDDGAIASTIERYANRTDRARADLSSSVDATEGTHSSHRPSSEQVDINAVLEIPHDRAPVELALEQVGPSVEILEIEDLPTSASAPSGASSGEVKAENSPENTPAGEPRKGVSAPPSSSVPYRDWSFEEKLASHHEWIESKGATGQKGDLTGIDLEGRDLIGLDLRFLDLHDADLRAADLLMADLRDACLVRTNFRDSCLVGSNLEAANLEGASLETAMGLVPRQLAGANLHEASLPPHIAQFGALDEFRLASRKVFGYFAAMTLLSVLSTLLILMTKDFQLLTNAAVLFFLRSPKAAAAVPTVQFYLIAPVVLFIVYLVFHFHLQHLWDLVLELPAIFPDGRTLGENEPRIIVGLLRAHFRWMNQDAPSTRLVEKATSILVAYWIVPATLLLYWLRFLTMQEVRGTVLHELLVVAATGAALYSTTKVGRRAERWTLQENAVERMMGKLKEIDPATTVMVLLGVLTFLAVGTMAGVPHNKERAPQFTAGSVRRWATSVLWSFGVDPYADLTEAVISTKPRNWSGADDQVPAVKGALLNNSNFRYAQAYRVFLANAHLLRVNFQGAFLSQADLRDSDMGQSNLRYAILDQAQMNHVNLDRAVLDGANLSRTDLRGANLSYASLANASLVDARLDGATLYGAKLMSATLIRTNFEKTDLREVHLESANLEHANLEGAYLWSAKLNGARLTNAQLGSAIFVEADLRNTDLRWAHLGGTVLTGADLAGANLDGADLRGAVGFGPDQICAAKSRHELLLDDAMQAQVTAQCGAN